MSFGPALDTITLRFCRHIILELDGANPPKQKFVRAAKEVKVSLDFPIPEERTSIYATHDYRDNGRVDEVGWSLEKEYAYEIAVDDRQFSQEDESYFLKCLARHQQCGWTITEEMDDETE